jgi:hypothetical protein
MAMPNKKGWLAILFIILCLAIPFGITFYVSTDLYKAEFDRWQGTNPQAPEKAGQQRPRAINDQVALVMGERIHVGNTSLVYRGIKNGVIRLDLYLEELDPDQFYVQTFSRKYRAGKMLRLGDIFYTIVSVSHTTLVLKILQKTRTR